MFDYFCCIFNSIRPSVVAVFLCCEYTVGLLVVLSVSVSVGDFFFDKFARCSRWMRVKYASRKNGFFMLEKGYPVQKWVGWFVNCVWKFVGRTLKMVDIFSFSFSKTGGDDSLRVGIFTPDEWLLSNSFVGGVFFYLRCFATMGEVCL